MMRNRLLSLAVGILTVAVLPVAAASPVSAAGTPSTVTTYSIINKSVVSSLYTNKSITYGACVIKTKGSTCSISSGRSVATQWQSQWGVSWGVISGSIGYSSNTSVTVTVSCTSPALPANTTYKAWPVGKYTRYQIRQTTVNHSTGKKTVTDSGYLYAFQAYSTYLSCGTA